MKRNVLCFSLLAMSLLIVLILNLHIGSTPLPFFDLIDALFQNPDSDVGRILWKIRIPRAFAALLLGGALALSGYLLQTFFQNPIAGPFVLGVSSGAKLCVAIAMLFAFRFVQSVNSFFLITAAFIGAMLSLGFVLLVSRKIKRMSMLVVCGVMIGYICSAATDFLVTFADDSEIANLHDWSLGTFSGTSMQHIAVIAAVVAVGFIGAFLISKPMHAYMLGEQYAKSMGVPVGLLKAALVILSGLLSACVTAFAGPVSFVGIAVPHIIRVIFRTSKPLVMIPAAFLGGSVFCMLCDMLARTAFSPTELSISTVTAIFGAPVVILILVQRKRGEL